jgi:glycosyltransferase involved in cell wall biosynthesis
MSKISIVFPTRNRPDNLKNLWGSIIRTASVLPEVVIYVDDDDQLSVPIAKELGFTYVQASRHILSQCYNEAAKLASGDILMFAGDDILFREKDWDLKVMSEFDKYEDKIAFVYGNDGHRTDELGTHGFIHRNCMIVVGYLLPPYFST